MAVSARGSLPALRLEGRQGRGPVRVGGARPPRGWACLVAQLVQNLLRCRRPRFDPWAGEIR